MTPTERIRELERQLKETRAQVDRFNLIIERQNDLWYQIRRENTLLQEGNAEFINKIAQRVAECLLMPLMEKMAPPGTGITVKSLTMRS
jgi:preprotein translocase subunit SecA